MTLQEQWKTMKNNWLIVLILIVMAIFFSAGDELLSAVSSSGGYAGDYGESVGMMAESIGYAPSRMMKSGVYPSIGNDDFAPEAEDRKITKTASLATEVERGTFQDAEQQLKMVVSSSNSFLLNENVNKYDRGRKSYYSGSYNLKIEVKKYDAVLSQLKQIGEVQSFSEKAVDITGMYTNIQTELEAERARLQRYNQMLAEAEVIADKIELSDRIFNQERTIKYLEEALRNQDKQVEYATIYVQITEKQSEFAGIALVTLGGLVHGLVSSVNNLLRLVFVALPWVLIVLIVWLGVRWVRRK